MPFSSPKAGRTTWNKTEIKLWNKLFSVSNLFQGFSHVKKYSGSHMWNKTEIKHCRPCSREIIVILFQFHFSFISCCASRFSNWKLFSPISDFFCRLSQKLQIGKTETFRWSRLLRRHLYHRLQCWQLSDQW